MAVFNRKISKNWEERSKGVSRRFYQLEFLLVALSLGSTLFLNFSVLSDIGFFRRTLFLLFAIGGISSFHFLFQGLWDLWAELHDRMESSRLDGSFEIKEESSLDIKSTIKIVLYGEEESSRKKTATYLKKRVTALSGADCDVIEAQSAEETLKFVTDHIVHLVILESISQNKNCSLWAEKIKGVDKNIPVVVLSQGNPISSPSIDAWFSYLQRDSDIEKILPYFLVRETKNGKGRAQS